MYISDLPSATPDSSAEIAFDQNSVTYKANIANLYNGMIAAADSYTIYRSVTDIGLTSGSATIAGAWTAMGETYVMLVCTADQFANGEVPTTTGVVELVKAGASVRGYINFYGKTESSGDWRMYLNDNGVPDGTWLKASLGSYQILGFQTVSCSSGQIAAGATGTATGTMTAVSGATGYWMWAYPNTIYGNPIGVPTRSGTTISVSVGNLSSGTHTILVQVCVIAYYKS